MSDDGGSMSIKRYRVVQSFLDEWPTGSWVKYDDHVAEVERLTLALSTMTVERNVFAEETEHGA